MKSYIDLILVKIVIRFYVNKVQNYYLKMERRELCNIYYFLSFHDSKWLTVSFLSKAMNLHWSLWE